MLKVITKAACPMCEIAKMELKKRNIEFEKFDFDDPEAQKIIKLHNLKALPIIVSDDNVCCGADAIKFSKSL